MRLVLIFQKCAWSSLEINIFLSLALQDAPRSVSCNLFAFFPLHTLSITSSKSSGDCSDIQSRPFEFFPQCPLFCPLSFFFPSLQFPRIAVCFFHFLNTRFNSSDAEITVDVRKIILAFLYFRLVSLTSTGSLIFLSLLTQPFCSLVVHALKKARLEEQTMGILKFSLRVLSHIFRLKPL